MGMRYVDVEKLFCGDEPDLNMFVRLSVSQSVTFLITSVHLFYFRNFLEKEKNQNLMAGDPNVRFDTPSPID